MARGDEHGRGGRERRIGNRRNKGNGRILKM